MLELHDPLWSSFHGGYKVPYDASPLLRALEDGSEPPEYVWSEFWSDLHHQGHVDLASYAAVPQIVRICIERNLLDWNAFALVACIEDRRIDGDNPPLPEWLTEDYHAAIQQLAAFGAQNLSENWDEELTSSFLSVVAFAKGQTLHGHLLFNYSEDEFEEMIELYNEQ